MGVIVLFLNIGMLLLGIWGAHVFWEAEHPYELGNEDFCEWVEDEEYFGCYEASFCLATDHGLPVYCPDCGKRTKLISTFNIDEEL